MMKLKHFSFLIAGFLILSVATTSCNSSNKVADDITIGTKMGQKAPEISLANPENETLNLTSLNGNIVLIDFWASWCGPCRRNNPHLVRLYNKYKSKRFKRANSFEIYSVSLDKRKDSWIKAIKADKLDWDYHVSDLKYWYSVAAADYKVNAIPSTFLVDANGLILATNPSLSEVDKILANRTK